MPQENQVLRCFCCETFQVHIVKKAKKWVCKICGAKQSFKRHYGKGTGKDCRNHVMKLNELRFTKSDIPSMIESETLEKIPQQSESNVEPEPKKRKGTSKWELYLDEDSNEIEDMIFKHEKRRKISDEFSEVLQPCKEPYQLPLVQSDDVKSSKCSEDIQSEGTTEKKKSKNIFDSGLDDDDLLNFI